MIWAIHVDYDKMKQCGNQKESSRSLDPASTNEEEEESHLESPSEEIHSRGSSLMQVASASKHSQNSALELADERAETVDIQNCSQKSDPSQIRYLDRKSVV